MTPQLDKIRKMAGWRIMLIMYHPRLNKIEVIERYYREQRSATWSLLLMSGWVEIGEI